MGRRFIVRRNKECKSNEVLLNGGGKMTKKGTSDKDYQNGDVAQRKGT